MTVSLGFDEPARATLPAGFGFLVPRQERRRMLACTFVHAKFDHRAPEGKAMLRCFLGGSRDPDALGLSDEEVAALVRRELKEILNFTAEPLFCRVHRWPASMAQYPVGHATRLTAIEQRLENLPGLYLSGNAYSGIGISDCIRTSRTAAERALDFLAPAWREGSRQ
jgi:oxygen-dependent protoporphyrinogen oxidase